MRPGGRLVVVASSPRTLDNLSDEVRSPFARAAAEGVDAVEQIVEEWRASVRAGRAVEDKFGNWLIRRTHGTVYRAWPTSGRSGLTHS